MHLRLVEEAFEVETSLVKVLLVRHHFRLHHELLVSLLNGEDGRLQVQCLINGHILLERWLGTND